MTRNSRNVLYACLFSLFVLSLAVISSPAPSSDASRSGRDAAAAVRPAPRDSHAMAYDPVRKKVVLFGGTFGTGNHAFDTWEWDGTKWTKVSETGPSDRSNTAMAYDPIRKKIVLFGGSHDYEKQNDTWIWDGTAWKLASTTGPEPRTDHAMEYFAKHKKVLLFGGRYYGDTWEWSGTKWAKKADMAWRSQMAMAYDSQRSRMVIFGGWTGSSQSDTWEYDGQSWKKVCETGPVPRSEASAAYDANIKKTVIFGGFDWIGLNLVFYKDTWAWNGKTWKKLSSSGPCARAGHAMVYDSFRKKIVLFGGSVGELRLGDTWEWNGKAWKKVDPK